MEHPPAKPTKPSAVCLNSRRSVTPLPLILLVLLVAAYAVGLCREIAEPWVGLHDWNGAFYSQLSRNFLRYPFEAHHGMPLVAVGADAPPEERSIYATHPAGLVWLLAAAFRVFGESEVVARSTAAGASLLALLLWVRLLGRTESRETVLLAGLLYSVLPMAVFFGRMVNHEPFCLLFMIAALTCWQDVARRYVRAWIGWAACIWAGMFIDWAGMLFAAVFCVHVLMRRRRRKISAASAGTVFMIAGSGAALTVLHIVYAGLDGRWSDLLAVFTSRSGAVVQTEAASVLWENVQTIFSLPLLVFMVAGVIVRTPSKMFADGRREGRIDAFFVPLVTGLLWMAVFRRQFIIHQYWAFYLGPYGALFAARGVLFLGRLGLRGGPVFTPCVAAAALALVIFAARRETNSLFGLTLCHPEHVEAWKQMRTDYPSDRRVPLPWNPMRSDRFGTYEFRNITPPQMAYYLDRPFVFSPQP